MNPFVVDVKIKAGDTLIDLEKHNSKIRSDASEVRIYLSKNYKKRFFNDTWISSLIANASLDHKKLVLTDLTEGSKDKITNRFSDSLIGLTSAYHADVIENSKHEKLQIDIDEIIKSIAVNQKGLIDDSSAGHTFVFCSFDSNDRKNYFPRPLALSAEGVDDFTEKFLKIKRNKIDIAFGIANQMDNVLFPEYNTYQREKGFASFIYELYENTFQHGNKDENNDLIQGMRSFSIRRHIAANFSELKRQAENFGELGNYLTGVSKHKKYKNFSFYEISIIDNGIGIIKRFLASRPEFKVDEKFQCLSEFQKLNYIITQSLSSKLFSGAGKGIKNALRNIFYLEGFLSIRTNNVWAYFDGQDQSSRITPQFRHVKTDVKIDSIRGTHYNILIPVSSH